MLTKIIYSTTILLLSVQNLKSQQDPLIGKKLFQGNFELQLNGESQKQDLGRDLSKYRNSVFNTNGLFGKINGQKIAYTFGFGVSFASEKLTYFNYSLNGKDIIEKQYRMKIGPSFGSTKFVTITENLYFVPSTIVNIYTTFGRDTSNAYRITGQFPYIPQNTPFIESAKTFGAGISFAAIPLRIGYLWKDKILLTTSIGNIGFIMEAENTKIKSLYYTGVSQNGIASVDSRRISIPSYNVSFFGSLINTASFGITYLF